MDTKQNGQKRVTSRRDMLRQLATLGSAAAVAAILPACANTAQQATNNTAVPGSQVGATSAAGGAANGTSAPAVQTAQAVTLRVWGLNADEARAKARLASFSKTNPSITIQPIGGNLNTQQLLTAVASGDPPEVVNVDRLQTGSWAGRNAIDPISDLVGRDGFDFGQFYSFLKGQVSYKDQIYGVPQFVNLDLLFMNGDVLKQAGVDPTTVDPGNWDQLTKLGAQLHQANGANVTRTGFDTKVQDGRLWLWSWANGAEPISTDGEKANFTDPKIIEVLNWAKTTVDAQGGEKARAAFAQSQNFFSPQNPVLIGQTAITVFEQWLMGVLKVNPQANFVAMLPRKRNSQETLTDATGQAFAIPRGIKDAKREAAWTFIKGMTSTDAWLAGERATLADATSQKQPYTPTMTGNIKVDEEVLATIYKPIGASYDATVKLLPDALKVARYRYNGPVAAQIADLVTAAVNDVLQGVRSAEEGMKDLQEKAQQAIDDFKSGPGVR